MTIDDLRVIAERMPAGAAVSIPREALLEALGNNTGGESARLQRDLSVTAVAELFGRQPSTVRGWLERGALRGYRLNGKAWRIPPGAIAEFRAGQA